MAHQPVGDGHKQLLRSATNQASGSQTFAVQSDTVRVVPTGQRWSTCSNRHNSSLLPRSDYFVPSANTPATLNLGRASSMGIAGYYKRSINSYYTYQREWVIHLKLMM